MDAIERGDLIEHATMTRVAEIYAGALRKALKNKKAFLQKIKDVDDGKIQPPKYYVDLDMVDKWREGFVRELMRQQAVIEGIMEELNAAGVDAAALIRKGLVEIYEVNREEMVQKLTDAAIRQGVNVSFAQYDKNQIAVLIQENQSPFTELAYENMGQNPAIRRRLQNELALATVLGESQWKIIQRIRAVTGQSIAQARRVAQTERTRVQSQARHMAGQEAADKGVGIVNEWSARMVNTRESHADLNGKKVMQGEKFRTIWGNELEFPGDPGAPAKEVINCFCVLAPDVLLPGQRLVGGEVVEAEKAEDLMNIETREQAIKAIGNSGFRLVGHGVEYLPDDQVIVAAKRLRELELRFGCAKDGNYTLEAPVLTGKYKKTLAFARSSKTSGNALVLNAQYFSKDTETLAAMERKTIASGWSMPCSENNAKHYTITHEYGHMLEAMLYKRRNGVSLTDLTTEQRKTIFPKFAKEVWNEVVGVAKEKKPGFAVTKSVISEYGRTDYAEAFAETFANALCGKPNELGNAMNVWLERNGFK